MPLEPNRKQSGFRLSTSTGSAVQKISLVVSLIAVLALPDSIADGADMTINWELDNLLQIAGQRLALIGRPVVVGNAQRAIRFDGHGDGLSLESVPIAGWKEFTIEVIFNPSPNGPREQRFVHLQESQSDNRVLIETRMPSANSWFLDTFIKSGQTDETLYAEKFIHTAGLWYHVALIFDGQEMRHYVNGVKEMSSRIRFTPLSNGQTSLGVRLNQVYWFQGDIRRLRFSPRALKVEEFLKVG